MPMLVAAGALGAALLAIVMVTYRADRVIGIAVVTHVAALVLVPALALGAAAVTGVFGLILGMDALAWSRRHRHRKAQAGRAPLLFLVVLITVMTVARQTAESVQLWALIVAAFVPPLLLASQANSAERRTVMRGLVLLAAAQAVAAWVEFVALDGPLWGVSNNVDEQGQPVYAASSLLLGADRSQGTMVHALPLSFLLVVGLGLLVRREVEYGALRRAALGALLISGCFLAGSRSAVVICALLAVFYAGGSTSRGRRALGIAAAMVVLATLWLTGFFYSDVVNRLLGSGSVYHRAELFDVAPRLLVEQPVINVLLGNGWGGASDLFAAGLLQTTGFQVIDNQVVTIMVAGGLLGVGLFLAALVACWRGCAPALRPALLAVTLMLGIFEVLGWHATGAVFGVLLGLAGSAQHAPGLGAGAREEPRAAEVEAH